jgi:hypothetical protein
MQRCDLSLVPEEPLAGYTLFRKDMMDKAGLFTIMRLEKDTHFGFSR